MRQIKVDSYSYKVIAKWKKTVQHLEVKMLLNHISFGLYRMIL